MSLTPIPSGFMQDSLGSPPPAPCLPLMPQEAPSLALSPGLRFPTCLMQGGGNWLGGVSLWLHSVERGSPRELGSSRGRANQGSRQPREKEVYCSCRDSLSPLPATGHSCIFWRSREQCEGLRAVPPSGAAQGSARRVGPWGHGRRLPAFTCEPYPCPKGLSPSAFQVIVQRGLGTHPVPSGEAPSPG